MKRIISYFWPVKKKTWSPVNGWLEVTWINGKKLLDSRNTNYSYGSLQKVLASGLSRIDFPRSVPVLLLGLGGGSVVQTLKERFDHTGKITAVDIDPVVIELAEKEFHIQAGDNLEIIPADAFTFIRDCREQFGLIIVDLFIDTNVPRECFSESFWNDIHRLLDPDGHILFNAGMNPGTDHRTKEVIQNNGSIFEFRTFEGVEKKNTLLIAKKLKSTGS